MPRFFLQIFLFYFLSGKIKTLMRKNFSSLLSTRYDSMNMISMINKKLIALRFPRIPYICSEKIETSYFLWEYSQEILTVGCEEYVCQVLEVYDVRKLNGKNLVWLCITFWTLSVIGFRIMLIERIIIHGAFEQAYVSSIIINISTFYIYYIYRTISNISAWLKK